MTNANSLPYYPRFILTCNDGRCFSTGDLDLFEDIKEKESNSRYEITSFRPGQKIEIFWANGQELKLYEVDKIEIQQIKYDLDESTKGTNINDCEPSGKIKKWMMEIYVFLNVIE